MAGRPAVPALVAEVDARGEGTALTTTLEGNPVLSAFSRPGPSGWAVAIGIPESEVFAPLWRSLALTAAGTALALLLALVLARRVSEDIARPVQALVSLAAAPRGGHAPSSPGLRADAPASLGLREADAVAAALLAAESARAESEERYRLAVESAEIGFWDVDPVKGSLIWPPRVKAMFGISADRPVSMDDFYAGLHPDDRGATAAAYAGAADPARRALYDVEYRTIGKEDGVVRWVAAKGRGVFDASGRCVRLIGTAVDITARKSAEAALACSEAELRRLNEDLEARVRREVVAREAAQAQLAHAQRMEALGQLAGGVAHDVNNVLQAVQGSARLIETRPEDPERVRRLARVVLEAASRGAAVTRRLLSFSRRADLRAEPVEAAPLLAGLREILAHTLGAGIDVRVEVRPGLPPLLADKAQLETVLVNLATNARDAMDGIGTITLSAVAEAVEDETIRLPPALRPGRYVRLSLADTGAGMDSATVARATEPFFTTKGIGKGTGLGLSMARGFAEQSGGALAIESSPGAGTTIRLWLPLAAEAGDAVDAAAAGSAAPARARVLLVDDEALVRAVTAEGLEDAGYDVLSLGSGAEALDALAAGAPADILVSDLSMPGMDGLALIRAAKAARPGLPAILLTGFATDAAEIAMDGALSGSFSLLRKPVEAGALAERAAALIGAAGDEAPGGMARGAAVTAPRASGRGRDGA
ncbi:ATP-binding protein [Roseomonas sp. CCTCC AB2023176]|uniref:ATP-binding protein n=1 Tax=Roseomonas sp. CCTCC AB2023176 TaxID=3342640 RepID=UPI0035D9EDB6